MTIKVATWNVNSVKQRLPQLLEWLKRDRPDIVLLQETKCTDDVFPAMEIEELGYNLALHGEKSYNGVAILSKFPLEDVRKGLPGDDGDMQARYIEAICNVERESWNVNRDIMPRTTTHEPRFTTLRVASVYVPNGQHAESEKFPYKLKFLDRLHVHIQTLLPHEEALAIGGDYNIAPEDIDVHDPKLWQGSVLTHDEVRRRLRRILYLGVYDAYRSRYPNKNEYSWWDYRANSFAQDNGLRIDHLLLSPQAADRLKDCVIEKAMRAVEKASDHTPVMGVFE